MENQAHLPSVHIFVISWSGQHKNAEHIANTVSRLCPKVTIVYSDPDDSLTFSTIASCEKRPNNLFWADKFSACLDLFADDVMLIIHADATCSDWEKLFIRCAEALRDFKDIGVWAPLIDWTPYSTSITKLGNLGQSNLAIVCQTDGIVFAMRDRVVDRLRKADLSKNIYGQGIDQLAIAFTYSNSLLAVVDESVEVFHPKTRGYPTDVAGAQWREFVGQFRTAEKIQNSLLFCYLREKNQKVKHLG